MKKQEITETDFRAACDKLAAFDCIDNDIVLASDLGRILQPDGPKKMTFILIILCTEGTARYTVDTHQQTVRKNDIVIISERHIVDNYVASADMQGLCMLMSVNFFYGAMRSVSDLSSLFVFSKSHHQVHLSQREADVFSDYFFMLKRKAGDKGHLFRRNIAQALFLAMFYDLSEVIHRVQNTTSPNKTRANEIFARFISLVEKNYKHERRVGWYAEEMGITPKYLSETVGAVSKRTPNEWIDNYVTLELRLQLKNSTKSIKDIAADLHFPNQSFLGKYFKEHVGMSPSEFRKK